MRPNRLTWKKYDDITSAATRELKAFLRSARLIAARLGHQGEGPVSGMRGRETGDRVDIHKQNTNKIKYIHVSRILEYSLRNNSLDSMFGDFCSSINIFISWPFHFLP